MCCLFICLFVSIELESETAGEARGAEGEGDFGESRPKTSRLWTPLEVQNSDYVQLLKDRRKRESTQDFIRENIVS